MYAHKRAQEESESSRLSFNQEALFSPQPEPRGSWGRHGIAYQRNTIERCPAGFGFDARCFPECHPTFGGKASRLETT